MAPVAVCHECDTYWRPGGRVVVGTVADIDFDDEAALDAFAAELLALMPEALSDPIVVKGEVDVLVRFVGPGNLPKPPDFHRKLLADLVGAIPPIVPYWKGGGTPSEFHARVSLVEGEGPAEAEAAVRAALGPWPVWEVVRNDTPAERDK